MAVSWRAALLALLLAVAATSAFAGITSTGSRCVVPRVVGQSLPAAKRRLAAAHCGVGQIVGPRSAKVSAQRPAAGRRERVGAKVALTLARPAGGSSVTTSGLTGTATPASSVSSAVTGTDTTGTDTTGTGTTGTDTTGTGTTGTDPTGTDPTETGGGSQPEPVGIPGNWNLVLDSEFSGSALDPSIWQTGWFGTGTTPPVNTEEPDCYSPANVTFGPAAAPMTGTVLNLAVTAQSSSCAGGSESFTGAAISSNPDYGRTSGGFQYTYGVLEAMVYVPAAGDGSIADWPAVWTDGQDWPTDGEDDVMEGISGVACSNFHYLPATASETGQEQRCFPSVSPGWHTFASDWEPGSITYYFDGQQVYQVTTGITSSPMYIVLDNTLNADQVADGSATPDTMQVAYVRVWQSAAGS